MQFIKVDWERFQEEMIPKLREKKEQFSREIWQKEEEVLGFPDRDYYF